VLFTRQYSITIQASRCSDGSRRPHRRYSYLTRVHIQTASRLFSRFSMAYCQHVRRTRRQTDHGTSVTIGRINELKYRVGQNRTVFLRVDNFVTVRGKVCDMSRFLSRKMYKTWMSVKLNILCVVCIKLIFRRNSIWQPWP